MQQYIKSELYKGLVLSLLQEKQSKTKVKTELTNIEIKKETPKVKNLLIKQYLLKTWKTQLQNKKIQKDNLLKLQRLAIELNESTELLTAIGTEIRRQGLDKNKL